MKILSSLNGYKTYLAALIVFVAGGLKALGIIDENIFEVAVTTGAALGFVGLRSAVSRPTVDVTPQPVVELPADGSGLPVTEG